MPYCDYWASTYWTYTDTETSKAKEEANNAKMLNTSEIAFGKNIMG